MKVGGEVFEIRGGFICFGWNFLFFSSDVAPLNGGQTDFGGDKGCKVSEQDVQATQRVMHGRLSLHHFRSSQMPPRLTVHQV